MNTPRLISALAVAGSIACAAAPSASAAPTDGQSASSANWSGYVAGGSSSGNATQFSSVSGSWTEPEVNCNSGQGYSAFWVGLGGAGQTHALEQTGTEADCDSNGAATHFAWYELVPAAPVRLDLKISPGDHVTGKVSVSGTDVTVSLSDTTTGQSATKNLQMNNPDVSSAEWIAEAPSSCDGTGNCQPLPLTNFGTVNFTNASATANGHTGTISDSTWNAQPVSLTPGATGLGAGGFVTDAGTATGTDTSSAGATPSGLSADGSSFSVAWGSADGTASDTSGGSGASGGYPPSGYDDGSGYGDGSSGYGDTGGYDDSGGSGYGDGGYWDSGDPGAYSYW